MAHFDEHPLCHQPGFSRVVVLARQLGDLSDAAVERGKRWLILHSPGASDFHRVFQFVADQRGELSIRQRRIDGDANESGAPRGGHESQRALRPRAFWASDQMNDDIRRFQFGDETTNGRRRGIGQVEPDANATLEGTNVRRVNHGRMARRQDR
jgi:hypothetical protein